MIRITKKPEDRKQEILDTSAELFYTQGYDKTSISDIAKKIGVSQGLCYRYFSSKEELFSSVLEYYAEMQAKPMISALSEQDKTLRQKLYGTPTFLDTENPDTYYYKICHQASGKAMHDLVSMKICQKLFPVIKKQLKKASDQGEIAISDLEATASFCIYGQLGILLHPDLAGKEKIERIREFLLNLLGLDTVESTL
ncbi:TetR/AcrR family transcriptional regulator [uncultured Sphaerochaeta sp.]|uniref:TetR/AcrR family transcriptional regulator n=1 Tax=uncultured Sphaerochaeta sp. TaxID=886478 RepID=UPI002A0A43E6|nr:TetR/AcrR family transcriptional regulator [uncultured Sphaerochaeta sp.]